MLKELAEIQFKLRPPVTPRTPGNGATSPTQAEAAHAIGFSWNRRATIAETLPGFEASALFGMGAPRNTPPEIIGKLNREINAVLAEPEVRKRLTELGGEPLITTPEDFGAMIAAETEKWEKVVKFADIKVE